MEGVRNWLGEWMDRLGVALLAVGPAGEGRLSEAERRELRRWLEATLQRRGETLVYDDRHGDGPDITP